MTDAEKLDYRTVEQALKDNDADTVHNVAERVELGLLMSLLFHAQRHGYAHHTESMSALAAVLTPHFERDEMIKCLESVLKQFPTTTVEALLEHNLPLQAVCNALYWGTIECNAHNTLILLPHLMGRDGGQQMALDIIGDLNIHVDDGRQRHPNTWRKPSLDEMEQSVRKLEALHQALVMHQEIGGEAGGRALNKKM